MKKVICTAHHLFLSTLLLPFNTSGDSEQADIRYYDSWLLSMPEGNSETFRWATDGHAKAMGNFVQLILYLGWKYICNCIQYGKSIEEG